MKKIITMFLFYVLFINAQQKNITFEVTTDTIIDSSAVYITGNNETLGNWDPGVVKLNRVNNYIWRITLTFPQSANLEFKFTLGSWDAEALNEKGTTSSNHTLTVINDSLLAFKVKNWGYKHLAVKGKITGVVKYHHKLAGKNIKPRDIIVWLPPDYEKEKDKRYPVLYAHDGQNLFDPTTSAFGIDWQMDETADSLIKQNKMQEIIIVGIYNTPDRMKEYMASEASNNYMNFIIDVLKPFIDKNYRTFTDRNNTASIGSSAGGTISFKLLWDHNDVFGKAACLSSAFKVNDYDIISSAFDNTYKNKKIILYTDCGGIGLDSLLLPGNKEMVNELIKHGYKENKDVVFRYFPLDEHNEPAWAKRLWEPLLFMFKKE